MFFGKCAAVSNLSRHRINSRSSTKSDILGVGNHIPGVIWTLCFLGGHGYKVNKHIVYQNN